MKRCVEILHRIQNLIHFGIVYSQEFVCSSNSVGFPSERFLMMNWYTGSFSGLLRINISVIWKRTFLRVTEPRLEICLEDTSSCPGWYGGASRRRCHDLWTDQWDDAGDGASLCLSSLCGRRIAWTAFSAVFIPPEKIHFRRIIPCISALKCWILNSTQMWRILNWKSKLNRFWNVTKFTIQNRKCG